MSHILRFARQQALALVAIALAMGSVAYAASLQLATTNTANKPTTLTNTGTGPALKLNVKTGQPPIAVNSDKVVPRLNASRLQGKAPGDFAAAGASYTKAQSDAKYAPSGSSYSTSQSDARYPRVLTHEGFSASLDLYSQTDAYNETINVPGNGTALIFVDRTIVGSGVLGVYVAGVLVDNDLSIPPYNVGSSGGFTLRVTFGTGTNSSSVTGHVTVLFIPD